jgi:ketosteroid isomerase-like protein
MTANHDLAVETAVRDNNSGQRDAMVSGDADALGNLLAEDFVLTHMTGYRQACAEWLADVRSGQMTYHYIQDVAITVEVSDGAADQPVLTARTNTEATIWGSRGTWPLQLEIHFTCDRDQWLAVYTVASTW